MNDTKYTLRYTSTFYNDLEQITLYIAKVLNNTKAANDLIDKVEVAIKSRLPVAEAFEPYQSKKERLHKYYRIYVKNYIIFYVVINVEDGGKIMELRRFLYNRQNFKKLL